MFVDFDAAEDLEASLVRIVHEEKGYARVVLQIPQADVLFVAAQICKADEAQG